MVSLSPDTRERFRLPISLDKPWFREIAFYAFSYERIISGIFFFLLYSGVLISLFVLFGRLLPFYYLQPLYSLIAATIGSFGFLWFAQLNQWILEQGYLDEVTTRRGFFTFSEWRRQEANQYPSLGRDGGSFLAASFKSGFAFTFSMLVISEGSLPLIGEPLPIPVFILAWIVSFQFAVASLKQNLRKDKVRPVEKVHIRGQHLLDFEDANAIAEQYALPGEPAILWGGLALPLTAGQKHFLYLGTTGSGKTSSILMLMNSVLNIIPIDKNDTAIFNSPTPKPARAFIYDPKCDMAPSLEGMGFNNYKIINPFDTRGWAWDVAADCPDESSAKILAAAFAPDPPERGGNQEFFQAACQNIIVRSIMYLNKVFGSNWGLADLCQLAGNRERLQAVLNSTKGGVATSSLLENRDVFPVLVNHMQRLETVANHWSHQAKAKKISLRRWVQEEGDAVLLTLRQQRERDLMLIYPIMLRALIDIVLDEGTSEEQTWFFLDEVQSFGNIPGLSKLMRMGRTSGACVVLGVHDYDGLKSIYGESVEEILGCCHHSAILKLLSPSTAYWACTRFGGREYFEDERTLTDTFNKGEEKGKTDSTTYGSGKTYPSGNNPFTRSRNRSRTKSKNESKNNSKSTSNAIRTFIREEDLVLTGELIGQSSVGQAKTIPAFYQGDVGCYSFAMELDFVKSLPLTHASGDQSRGFLPDGSDYDGPNIDVLTRWARFDTALKRLREKKETSRSPKISHEWEQ